MPSPENKTYYNNMKELHEDKYCYIAWESLQQNGLTDNEWEELNHIAEISEILVQIGQGKLPCRAYRKNMSMASYTFPTVFITILYIFPTL